MEATNEMFQALQAEIKALRKDLRRVKALLEDPTGEKSKARVSNNGFNKPLEVSDKLRAFLKLAADEKISRSQVTKRINEYVTLQGLKAGQVINLDATLKDLLTPPEGINVTFLNIQKYINPHFVKEPKEPKGAKRKEAEPTLSITDVKVERPKVAKKLKPAATA
jgi:upstream activation factor subunit UAF30